MCKEEYPFSAVDDAMSLLTPETIQTNDEIPLDETAVFPSAYLRSLARSGYSITAQDIERMGRLAYLPIREEHLVPAWHYQDRSQPWLLDRNRRFQDPEEYTSDTNPATDNLVHTLPDVSTSESEHTTQQPEEHASDPDPTVDDLGYTLRDLSISEPDFTTQASEGHVSDPDPATDDLVHILCDLSTSGPHLTTQESEGHVSDPDPATDDLGHILPYVPSSEPF